jgi:tRNA modification GTPase
MLTLDDTIAAVASAAGGGARGIVRLSGPQTVEIVSRCFRAMDIAQDWKQIKQATAISGRVSFQRCSGTKTGSQPAELSADLFLWPTHRSYTRQPLAEIHTIGSPPLLQAVLQAVCAAGARLAEPGEFTLRAFLAGRIDLTQAEAVLGVIDAADRRQLHAALTQLAGGLSRPLQGLRSELLDLLADLEAGLDFVEDDIRFVAPAELRNRLAHASLQMEQLGQQLSERGTATSLPRVVLAGSPNVGKSSLFNAMVGSAAALVSPQAGTTRDYLTATIETNGSSFEIIDTAGIEPEKGGDSQSILRTAQAASASQQRTADLQLLCLDATRSMDDWERDQLAHTSSTNATLVVLTKCDQPVATADGVPEDAIQTSSRTGLGLDKLREAIGHALMAQPNDALVLASTADRVRDSIRAAADSLSRAHALTADAGPQASEELVAAELRAALAELGKVVGAVYTDDLLDRVFSRFCIGK